MISMLGADLSYSEIQESLQTIASAISRWEEVPRFWY
jgi:hypothetical protein